MIIVQINGGLGNQLFQYAAGRALAERLRRPLLLDTEVFATYKVHRYSLDHLQIDVPQATPDALARCRARGRTHLKRLLLNPLSTPPVYHEPHFHFDPGVLRLTKDVYLEGYFQSEKYFSEYATLIRSEARPRAAQDGRNSELAAAMRDGTSVSLHIRRGDYLSNPAAARYHGLAPMEYYATALKTIGEKHGPFRLFVFSDDSAWAKGNLKADAPMVFVDHNGDKNYEDLRLMSQCDHNIIANSTFSWWGAWLNENPSKTVIAPKRWFHGAPHRTTDLFPPEWLAL